MGMTVGHIHPIGTTPHGRDDDMTDHFEDHGVTLETAVRVVIRRDNFMQSRPWHADVHFPDGQVWRGWQSFFRSKKALTQNARAALDTAGMYDAVIVDA